jgi:hypothetical protein
MGRAPVVQGLSDRQAKTFFTELEVGLVAGDTDEAHVLERPADGEPS